MKYLILLLTITFSFAVPAYALLEDNDDGTITSTNTGLMWLQDANYAQTSGIGDVDGGLLWTEAVAWISLLNSENYLGYNDWRLPDTSPVNGVSFNNNVSYDGSTDLGYNISAPESAYSGSTASELSYMYYVELGNLGYFDTSGNVTGCSPCLTNTGPFMNIAQGDYWSTEHPDLPNTSWTYETRLGQQYMYQDNQLHDNSLFVWAVRDVTVVPEPISSILFLTGAGALAVRRYFKRTPV